MANSNSRYRVKLLSLEDPFLHRGPKAESFSKSNSKMNLMKKTRMKTKNKRMTTIKKMMIMKKLLRDK